MVEIIVENASVDVPNFVNTQKNIRSRLISTLLRRPGTSTSEDTIVRILNNINFHASENDRIGLYGPNGAGKTSLLRLLAGIYTPSVGKVFSDGKIKTLFSLGAGLDPELDGYDNIVRLCLMNGLNVSEAKKYQKEIAEFSDLGNHLRQPVRTYSSGMILRLLSGPAFLTGADIVLVDEFFGVGDAEFAIKVRAKMEQLIDQAKIFIFSSHSIELLLENCDRFFIMEGGSGYELSRSEFLLMSK